MVSLSKDGWPLSYADAEASDFALQLLGAVRQGIYFGVETRVPYALTSIMRPYLFAKPARPLRTSLRHFAQQTLHHGWIIARISVLFKVTERALARAFARAAPRHIGGGTRRSGVAVSALPAEWHSFAAGALAGYVVMCGEKANASLKRQINMAIGIRTLYALCSYFVRNGWLETAGLAHHGSGGAYERGERVWVALLWGVVMWHWRHHSTGHSPTAPGEMVPSQVKQMDFIYSAGDSSPLHSKGWLSSNYLLWTAAALAARRFL